MGVSAPALKSVHCTLSFNRIAVSIVLTAVMAKGCTSTGPSPAPSVSPAEAQPPFTRTPVSQTAPEVSSALPTTSTFVADYAKTNGIDD